MIVEIKNSTSENACELCILEFQGELIGDLPGSDVGNIKINSVRFYPIKHILNFSNQIFCALRMGQLKWRLVRIGWKVTWKF